MNTLRIFSVATLALIGVAGCESDGLSMREHAGGQYSNLVLSLSEESQADGPGKAAFAAPARIAVAQIGEVDPPAALIEKLRNKGDLFGQVQGMPGISSACEKGESQADLARREMRQMLRFAQDMGMDDLLVLGGTVDYGESASNASVLDLTIVGLYLAPTHQLSAQGRAAAALVDVHSGRVLFTVVADQKGSRLTAAATEDGEQSKLLSDIRDKLIADLGDKVLAQAKTIAKQAG